MRINIIINDETIRRDVSQAVENLFEDGEIDFVFESEKTEFISDCVDDVIEKYELYEYYSPNYEQVVRDMFALENE